MTRKIIVLCVDDHPLLREGIAAVLNGETDIVLAAEATNGKEAVESFRACRPDVTLMDLQMPVMNGIDAIIQIRREFPNARFIVLTTYQGDVQALRALKAGASGYLLKTSPFERIVESVHQVMAGGSPMSPRVATSVLEMFTRMAGPKKDFGLTEREREVLELMKEGLTKKEIAGRLELSFHTVDDYLRNIYTKLHVHSQAGAVAKAMKHELF